MSSTVLFVDHAPAIGGAENSLLLLLKHLDRERWRSHLAGVDGPLVECAATLGVTTHVIDMPRLRRSVRFLLDWTDTARMLADLAGSMGAALLYANTVRAAFYTAPAAHLVGRPFIWHVRDFWLSESKPRVVWLDRMLKRMLCLAAERVIANSAAVTSNLPRYDNITVVHNGIEVEAFNPTLDGHAFRAFHDISAEVPLVGMVGRLRPWKGAETFLHVAGYVHEQHPAAHFVIVGGTPLGDAGNYAEHLRRLTHELDLADAVTFTGHLDDVAPALAAMDVFVHPGDPEPFGLVNVEAMAMAKPVVAFAHGALPEIVVDGETGYLVSPGDESALARTVTHLIETPELARKMGRAGRARVENHFTIERTASAISRILHEVT